MPYLQHYDNPHCEGEKEFQDDLKRFKYIKRLLRKYYENDILKERLLINHIIVLSNVFEKIRATLLIFKIQKEHWHALKAFCIYLNILREDELPEITLDKKVMKVLKEL